MRLPWTKETLFVQEKRDTWYNNNDRKTQLRSEYEAYQWVLREEQGRDWTVVELFEKRQVGRLHAPRSLISDLSSRGKKQQDTARDKLNLHTDARLSRNDQYVLKAKPQAGNFTTVRVRSSLYKDMCK